MPITRSLSRPIHSRLFRALTDAGVGSWAASLPTATRYVSQTATNDFATGTNTGAGSSKSSPWLTLDYAIANSVSGDVIHVNDGTYTAATFYNVSNKSLTIAAANSARAVTLKAADAQTRIANINLTASMTLTLLGLVLDGRNNTTRGISIGGAGVALGIVAGLSMRACTIKDCTTRYIDSPQQKSVNYSLADVVLSGSMGGRPLYVQDAQEGTVAISGLTFATTMTAGNFAGVEINRAAGGSGLAVSVAGVGGTLTASGAFVVNGVVIRNVPAAEIRSCNLTTTGASISALYKVFSDSATLDANNAVVSNNAGSNLSDGGYCVLVGSDASGAGNNNHNNATVEGNNITANAAAASLIHGYMLGFGTGGTVSGNTVTGAAHALLAKVQAGGVFSGNTASNFVSDGIYAKGVSGTIFSDNTLTVDVPNSQGTVRVGPDDVTLAVSTGVEVSGNTFNVLVDPPKVVTVAAGSDAAFAANTYNIAATLAGLDPWGYQGTAYADLAAWKAVEPTALP